MWSKIHAKNVENISVLFIIASTAGISTPINPSNPAPEEEDVGNDSLVQLGVFVL